MFNIFVNQKMPITIKKFLNKPLIRFSLQNIPFVLLEKISEKNADLGAASLGPDVIKGGIKFFETWEKIEDDRNKAILDGFETITSKRFISALLSIKNFGKWLTFDTHPSLKERIRYLKAKLVDFENKTKQ
jgi:hypothetical protein